MQVRLHQQGHFTLMVCRAKVTPKLNWYSVQNSLSNDSEPRRQRGGWINSKRETGVYANAGSLGIMPRDVLSCTIAEVACCDSCTPLPSSPFSPPCFLHSLSMERRASQACNYSDKSPSAHATHCSLTNTHQYTHIWTHRGLSYCMKIYCTL